MTYRHIHKETERPTIPTAGIQKYIKPVQLMQAEGLSGGGQRNDACRPPDTKVSSSYHSEARKSPPSSSERGYTETATKTSFDS